MIVMLGQFKTGKVRTVPNWKDDVGCFTLLTVNEVAEFEHRDCQLL